MSYRTTKKNPNRVRAGRRSRRKGNNFERELATDLEKRYGDPSLPIEARNFRRTPLSGGFRINSPGDLIVPDWFPFIIEAKKYHVGADLLDITTMPHKGSDHQLFKWWDKEYPRAINLHKELLIVFCKGRNKPLALGSMSVISRLDLHLARGITKEGVTVLGIRNPTHDLFCLPYHTLFDRATKESLTSLASYLKFGSAQITTQADKSVKFEVGIPVDPTIFYPPVEPGRSC